MDVKIIVWRCTGGCGGLGDRQRGILTSFMLALVTKRAFFIHSTYPVPFEYYFHLARPDLHWVFSQYLLDNRTVLEEDIMNVYPSIGDYKEASLSYYDSFDVVIQKSNFWQPFNILGNPSAKKHKLLRSYEEHVLAGCLLNYTLYRTFLKHFPLRKQLMPVLAAAPLVMYGFCVCVVHNCLHLVGPEIFVCRFLPCALDALNTTKSLSEEQQPAQRQGHRPHDTAVFPNGVVNSLYPTLAMT